MGPESRVVYVKTCYLSIWVKILEWDEKNLQKSIILQVLFLLGFITSTKDILLALSSLTIL